MRIESILNKVQKCKSFVYKKIRLGKIDGQECLEVDIVPRKNSRAICSCCDKAASL